MCVCRVVVGHMRALADQEHVLHSAFGKPPNCSLILECLTSPWHGGICFRTTRQTIEKGGVRSYLDAVSVELSYLQIGVIIFFEVQEGR